MHIPGYQIERELGQGGMAIVYLATQESLHRPVALKVIKPALTTDEEFAQRFLREGRIIAQLSDPHIVTVYDIGSCEEIYYLSMEYLPGGTLQQRIRDGLPLVDSLIIGRALVGALDYAHHRNVIHRDIKPQNILFRENGQPVLTDFGIAKTLGSNTIMTRTGLSLGTPRYMSPEQIRGQGVDARSDLYSFGVLLYEMLTGKTPYNADDSFALAMMHVTAPIPELPPALSRFQPLLNRLLDKNPDQRFQNGQDVIAALDAVAAGDFDLLSVTRPVQSVAGSGAHPSGWSSWKIGVPVAVLAGAALVGGYGFLYRSTPTIPQPPVASTLAIPAPAIPTPPIDPSNTEIDVQRRMAADQHLAQARQRQQDGALEDSLAHIEQGLRQVPDHSELLVLRADVTQQISDAKNQQVQKQQAQLQAEQFLEQAQSAQQEGAINLSLIHIEQGLQAMPDHPGLLSLKQDMLRQQAELQRQQVELQRQQEASRQQAEAAERKKIEAEQSQRKADELLARALDEQRHRAYESSLLHIEQGLQQVPDHRRLLALREEVRKQLREAKVAPPPAPVIQPPADDASKIAALLRECQAHLKAKRLTSGKGGNAADCYAEVLRRDRGNAEALAGLEQIADRYADLVASALQGGDTRRAKSLLERLESLAPNHSEVSRLRGQLTAAQAPKSVAPLPTQPEPPVRVAESETPTAPPINLVSVPQPAESPPEAPDSATRVVTPDRHTQIARTQVDGDVSLQVTTSPQGLLDDVNRAAVKKQALPNTPAQLMIRSDVEEAEIWINNRKVGTVPMQIEMRPGSYRVRVRQDGYTDWNGKVDLAPGDESSIIASLSRKLEVATVPPSPVPVSKPEAPPAEPEPPVRAPEPPARAPEPQVAALNRPSPGCLSGGCQNGQGVYRYPDGSEYSGEFRDAKMHGHGTYLYARRGEKYVGEWRNGVIHGQGTYYYRSGNRYDGEWRNGRKNGQGAYIYADRGERYVGDFANDEPNGQGIYYYSNGDRYEGEWRNGRKNGQGVLYEGGQKIVGEWRNDQKAQVRVEP